MQQLFFESCASEKLTVEELLRLLLREAPSRKAQLHGSKAFVGKPGP